MVISLQEAHQPSTSLSKKRHFDSPTTTVPERCLQFVCKSLLSIWKLLLHCMAYNIVFLSQALFLCWNLSWWRQLPTRFLKLSRIPDRSTGSHCELRWCTSTYMQSYWYQCSGSSTSLRLQQSQKQLMRFVMTNDHLTCWGDRLMLM